jgi:hypothetical protein
MLRWLLLILISILGAGGVNAQDYVGRYDVYGGFTYLGSPDINLAQRGFHFQTGFRPRRWLSLGFDYSISTGHTSLSGSYLTTQLQQQLGAQLAALAAAGQVPPGYSLSVPFDATTQTFAAGPQLDLHHFHKLTIFVRPSIGAIHELATLHPVDPIAAAIAAQLAPSGQKTDWTGFYGFGGGVTLRITDHVGIRLQADFVHNHLFSDLLKDGRNTVRLSIGPAFQFGRNVR